MTAGLVAPLDSGALMAANLLASTVTMALGTVVAAFPRPAAKIWGAQRLAKLDPERRALFVGWYPALGWH
jgi:hypothetical protein